MDLARCLDSAIIRFITLVWVPFWILQATEEVKTPWSLDLMGCLICHVTYLSQEASWGGTESTMNISPEWFSR